MTSSVPQSAKLPPPLHSPHSPYSKGRPSAFGSCFDDFEEVCNRRPQQQRQQQQQQTHFRIRSDAERTDTETSSVARWSVHSSQPTTPCTEGSTTVVVRGVKTSASTPAFDTPPSLGKSKDARLACRQSMEEAYAPTTTETSGDSGRPQKKELRIEDCSAQACMVNRAIFSPASALSATTASIATACTGGRDSSIFSFTSSVPEAYLASLPIGRNNSAVCGLGRCPAPSAPSAGNGTASSPLLSPVMSPALSTNIPAPPSSGGVIVTLVEQSPTEHAAGNASANEDSASLSRISKCKRRLQSLNRPAFDLKAVQEAQGSFLEEEVCNAAQCNPLSEITPLLCVGTWKDAANLTLLRQLGIKYVLNVARELDPAAEANAIAHNKDIVYESIPMSDCHSQDVGEHLRQAFEFIERARAAKSRVLVHCRRGISRSPAIVVGYLMASEHRTYEEALKFVTERRSCVSLNLAFQERLSEYVPSGEFYHGPPPSSPSNRTQSSPAMSATSGRGGVLPSLSSMSSCSDQGASPASASGAASAVNNNGAGNNYGSSFRLQQSSHTPNSASAQLRRSDDALPPARGSFGASSSNASSRASSNVRQNPPMTAVPSAAPNFSRVPHRPRLTLQKGKSSSSRTSTLSTTPVMNPKSSASRTATPSTTSADSPSFAAGTRPHSCRSKSSWLEEEVTNPFSPALTGAKGGSAHTSRWQTAGRAKAQPTTPLFRPQAMRLAVPPPPRCRRGFADAEPEDEEDSAFHDARHRSNSSPTAETHSCDEEEIDKPG
jgi:protein-tyrosine phosphatase